MNQELMQDIRRNSSEELSNLKTKHESLLREKNHVDSTNGICERYVNPIVTADHTPLTWRYDLNPATNPFMQERIGVNATLNAGAIFFKGKFTLVVRVEGADRKSFFAVAQSPNGIDQFEFWDYPILLPETDVPDTNVYDMRLTEHEDGWIYGLFCTERRPENAPAYDQSIAEAKCGIARTKDLVHWERLYDLESGTSQQRNVVLHPEFVDGKYALYTRPQDGFINAGSGGGIGWSLIDSMENAVIQQEIIVDGKEYHTVKEVKNGQGPPPIKTDSGWIHLAHGVRNTAAGLRYVLYMFMTALDNPAQVIYAPGGHFLAPEGSERVGDVSNVLFANGWIERNGKVYIYYASSDTRMHVATSSVDRLIDYCKHTPKDELRSYACVQTRNELINRNLAFLKNQ